MIREIVTIDEEKCDGCGLCVPACHEGAIRVVNGKARLASDRLCDGLGACLGHCPQDAIRIERREADEFDEAAVAAHAGQVEATPAVLLHAAVASVQADRRAMPVVVVPASVPSPAAAHAGGCPSQRFARLAPPPSDPAPLRSAEFAAGRSELGQWPVQLRLLPARAPVFQNADLLLTADCVPFALPNFHDLLQGHALAIACPKLDDTSSYVPKLTEIISANQLKSITVVHMEVPCCTGILMMVLQARANSGVDVPIDDVVVSVRGEILSRRRLPALGG